MWFGRRSLSRHKNHRRGSGDQRVNIGASRFVMIWGRRGASRGEVLRDIWGGGGASQEVWGWARQEVGWWVSCNLQLSETSPVWSDVLCVSGDVIFSTLKSMLHARRIGVKRVEKATGEYFSNLSRSTRLSQVILNLFERQEDRRGGCKKQGEGWMAKLVKRWTLLFLSVQRWGKECRKHFHTIMSSTPGEREGEVALLSWTWSWSAQSTSLKNIS